MKNATKFRLLVTTLSVLTLAACNAIADTSGLAGSAETLWLRLLPRAPVLIGDLWTAELVLDFSKPLAALEGDPSEDVLATLITFEPGNPDETPRLKATKAVKLAEALYTLTVIHVPEHGGTVQVTINQPGLTPTKRPWSLAPAPDTRTALSAGPPVTVPAASTTAEVTFTGAEGLTLSAADFAVNNGAVISSVLVSDGSVTISLSFPENLSTSIQTYTVSIAADSPTIKGIAAVALTQEAADSDTRRTLSAGMGAVVAAADTTADLTFIGAIGLGLSAADFAVTAGGTISDVDVADDVATVTVSFAANMTDADKSYSVSIAAGSPTIKGAATVGITQATRITLNAGAGADVAAASTTADLTFTGASGLSLSDADFAVTSGAAISAVSVADDVVTVSISFAANTTAASPSYTVSIAADSAIIKGSAALTVNVSPFSYNIEITMTGGASVYTIPASGVSIDEADYSAAASGGAWIVSGVEGTVGEEVSVSVALAWTGIASGSGAYSGAETIPASGPLEVAIDLDVYGRKAEIPVTVDMSNYSGSVVVDALTITLDGTTFYAEDGGGTWNIGDVPEKYVGQSTGFSLTFTHTTGMWQYTANASMDEAGVTLTPDSNSVLIAAQGTNFLPVAAMQTFTATVAGTYKIQVWGARGGIYNNILGGAGGYAEGVVTLTLNQTLYVYVGGAGAVHTNSGGAGGWNGGGKGGARNGSGYGGSGGGGASDVRLVGGAWNEADSLASRFIVAGGGGGKSTRSAAPGVGGGLTGGRYATAGQSAPANPGTAGVGSFGIGAVGYTSIRTGTEYPQRYGGSGGGGGYWGGGADASIANPGGGGSGFVKGFNGCNNTDNFDALSGITVSNPVLYAGNVVFLSPTGVDETGHRDSGYVRITKQSD